MNVALVLAGGMGSRLGAPIPKQYINVRGKPILAYTLEKLQENKNIDYIEIVYHEEWLEKTKKIVMDYEIDKVKFYTKGGNDFQESVMNGVFHLRSHMKDEDTVVLFFGVSPLTSHEIINHSIEVCHRYGNGIATEDMVLCTCVQDDEYSSTQHISRDKIKGFSNPWSFNYGELYRTYKNALNLSLLDEIEPHTTSLYLALNKPLYFSKSNSLNFKITTKEDLQLFEGYLILQEKHLN